MSAFMAGVMIGAFILGKLADRWPNIVIILSIKIMHLYSLLTYLLTTTIILVFSSTFQLLHVPRIGRKHTITITVLGITICNTVSGLTNSFDVYVGAKFLTGFFCAGNILSMFVLSNELVGGSKRALVGTTMQVVYGNILLSIQSFCFRPPLLLE